MRPGEACLNCHTGGGGTAEDDGGGDDGGGGGDDGGGGGDDGAPLYTLAGTVYPTAHEPNDCVSNRLSGAVVTVFDSTGRAIATMTVNAAGNFFSTAAVRFPITARVTFQGRERVMTTPQNSGNCNSCHTQNGANGAPGRILAP